MGRFQVLEVLASCLIGRCGRVYRIEMTSCQLRPAGGYWARGLKTDYYHQWSKLTHLLE